MNPEATLVAHTHKTVLTRGTPARMRRTVWWAVTRYARSCRIDGDGDDSASARRIVLLATGRNKGDGGAPACRERITTRVPASFLQLHPSVEVWVDQNAAAKLSDAAK